MRFLSLSFFVVLLSIYYKLFENYKSYSIKYNFMYLWNANEYNIIILILYMRAVLSLLNLLLGVSAGFSISLSLMMNGLMAEVDFICLISFKHFFVHLTPWCSWSLPLRNSFFSLYLLTASSASSLRSTFSRLTYWHRWHIDPSILIFMWDLWI